MGADSTVSIGRCLLHRSIGWTYRVSTQLAAPFGLLLWTCPPWDSAEPCAHYIGPYHRVSASVRTIEVTTGLKHGSHVFSVLAWPSLCRSLGHSENMTLLTGYSWGPLRITASTKCQHNTAGAAWSFQPGQKWTGTQGHAVR